MRIKWCTSSVSLFILILSSGVLTRGAADKEHEELAKALAGAKVSLEAGLAASSAAGRPISAKFEVEDGKLQLSVYVEKSGEFSEVVIDHQAGTVVKTEEIDDDEREDFTAAKAQSEAMAKAKLSLGEAVERTLKGNTGYRAVSVFPAIKDGHPVAEITLVKGEDWKSVTEKLD